MTQPHALVSTEAVGTIAMVILLKASILLAVGLASDGLRARGRLAARSTCWMLVFAGAIVLPLIAGLLPQWSLVQVEVRHGLLDFPLLRAAPGVSLGTAIFAIWLAGVVVALVRLAADWRAGFGIAARGTTIEPGSRLALMLTRACREVGIDRAVRLVASNEIASPAIVGWQRPIVMVPAAALSWPADHLLGVLCHELAHVRRGDWAMHIVERIACAIYWINPLVHVARRRAAYARELAADRAAIRAGVAPERYARRIIEVARACLRPPRVALAFGSPNDLDRRVRSLFEPEEAAAGSWTASIARMLLWAVPVQIAIATAQPFECVPGSPSSVVPAVCSVNPTRVQ
jgi:beta-lactamase regulating signal transducer with metallopeptidase domain